MNLFNRIFTSNNESYAKAKVCLSRIKTKLDTISDNISDVTISEMLYLDKKWSMLPSTIGFGVSVMGLEINDNYSSLLAHYNNKAYLVPHEHKDDFELNKIIKGSLSNKLTGERFETGDTFIIDKNERHYLIANEETYVYCLITPNEDFLNVPQIKPSILKRFNQL